MNKLLKDRVTDLMAPRKQNQLPIARSNNGTFTSGAERTSAWCNRFLTSPYLQINPDWRMGGVFLELGLSSSLRISTVSSGNTGKSGSSQLPPTVERKSSSHYWTANLWFHRGPESSRPLHPAVKDSGNPQQLSESRAVY